MKNKFRDPIHGFIEVTDDELRLINTEEFQRLRRIKQLATTYLVYHGAEHTRFGHSLGVLETVSKAFDSAVNNYKEWYGKDLFDENTRKTYRQILRLIGLLHDIGHLPFSHAAECLLEEGVVHEDFTKAILFSNNIAKIIKDIGKRNGSTPITITPQVIWDIYNGSYKENLTKYSEIYKDLGFLKSFVDGDLDCDKIDYLLRDSYYCGVNYGKFDLNRLLSCLNVYVDEFSSLKKMAFDKNGLCCLEEFILARYFMFIQVYFHRTRRYLDKQFERSLEYIYKDKKLSVENLAAFLREDDGTILEKIRSVKEECPAAKSFLDRTIYKLVCEGNPFMSPEGIKAFENNKNRLETKLGKINVLEDSSKRLVHKLPSLYDYDDINNLGIPIISKDDKTPENILGISIILKSLKDPIEIKRLYVPKSYEQKAKKLINGDV